MTSNLPGYLHIKDYNITMHKQILYDGGYCYYADKMQRMWVAG